MINLLPPNYRNQLRAAQANTLLLRYNIFLLGALLFIGLALGVVFFYLTLNKANAERTLADNKARVGEYASVEQEAADFRSSLETAKQILDKQITYTKTVVAITKLMPSGTVLQDLSLDASTFGTPTSFVFQAKDYGTALSIKDSFQSSPLFSDVHLQSIAAGSSDDKSGYPYTVTLGMTITKDAAK